MQFASLEELECVLDKYSKDNCVKFWKRDCRKISSCRIRLKSIIKPELEYCEIKYACIYGGRPQSQRRRFSDICGTEILPEPCKAYIFVKANETGEFLVIKGLDLNHNHKIRYCE